MAERDYMLRAIELAKRGMGWTNPNPMVGAVVVKDGRIIAEGWHQRCGEFHAERNALLNCTEDPEGATIYVTLEPCCHYGKTPPCTEIIIEKKLKKVVIGSRDPNPLVSGKGAASLREHGIEVEEDFMREECDAVNPVFFHYIRNKDPYVVMKFAMTLDGKIASRTGASKWITGEAAREHVHRLRSRYAAIMAGIGTVLADDPMLNCRIENAEQPVHQPVRVICDSRLRIPEDSQIIKTAGRYRTIIAACSTPDAEKLQRLKAAGAEVWIMPEDENGEPDLKALMKELGGAGIDSVLAEGGGRLHEAILRAGIADHVCAYIAPKLFGGAEAKTPVEGIGVRDPSEAALLENRTITPLGPDILLEYDFVRKADGAQKEGQVN